MVQKSGSKSPVQGGKGSLSHYLQGFIYPRWLALGCLPSIAWLCFRSTSSWFFKFRFASHQIRLPGVAPGEPVRNLRDMKQGQSLQSSDKLLQIIEKPFNSNISSPNPWKYFFFCKNHLQNPSPTSVLECLSPNLSYSLVGRKKIHPRVFIPKLSTIPKQIPRFFAPLDTPGGLEPWASPTGDHDEVHVLVPLAFAGLNEETNGRMFQSDSKIDPLVN